MLAVQADGHEVVTVEGLATASEAAPDPREGSRTHGLQCGFCTPGMMLTAKALLDDSPNPTEDEVRWALSGNLCRCTGCRTSSRPCWPGPPKQRGGSDAMTALDEIKIGGLGS